MKLEQPRHEAAGRTELYRGQALVEYIASVRDAGEIDDATAAAAHEIWRSLAMASERPLPVPDAAPGPDGQLLYAWNCGEHHLEIEIFPNGPAEFFYLNRATNETWEDEYTSGTSISSGILARLAIFQ